LRPPIAGILGQSQAPGMRLADATVVALFAVGPVLANLPRRWSRRALALGSVALAAGAALGTAIDPGTSDSASDIALGAAVLAVIYVALLHRSLRGQVLPVFVVAAVAMLALAGSGAAARRAHRGVHRRRRRPRRRARSSSS
jgi:hypothetical protein